MSAPEDRGKGKTRGVEIMVIGIIVTALFFILGISYSDFYDLSAFPSISWGGIILGVGIAIIIVGTVVWAVEKRKA